MDIRGLIREYKHLRPETDWSQKNMACLEDYFSIHFGTKRTGIFIFRPVYATLCVVFVIFLSGTGLAYASYNSNSLPGDFLYPIKKISEKAKLALTLGRSQKTVLRAELLDRRVDEIKILKESNSPFLGDATSDFQKELKTFKKEIAVQINPEMKEIKTNEVLSGKTDLPVEDQKKIIPYIGNAEEVKKILAETKELLSQKNLEVALEKINYLENMSEAATTTKQKIEIKKEEETKNTTSSKPKPSSSKKIEPLVGSVGSLMILDKESPDMKAPELGKENE